ncbi:MFS transporter [Pseudomonas sp. 10B1]|uniref:MFS transporter n=1 Tax=unclassified Pseudomonas TaxID=196821 RepID=UPI002AB4B454|nr:MULTISPECIES: MFS transporter [unclassified Pseudomonas]MDY7560872.1 MFS transporter [Pseudomonas sp. AB6]MEA9976460.1 MFS transporter [Pseudomonas sp. RTS4]MEA9996177.1 MFS transporter [Pseudomonas sp. AA4]MEB0088937.1 MFS transporter [Pseudomonas sp. RTI1]MEB0128047.1 MFS transporter [Pseudomonas sp. CCC1.2]
MRRRLIASVLLGHYLSAFTALGIPLYLPRILADLAPNAPGWSIGVLFVLPTLCTALAAPLWGRWADRRGCRLSLLRAHAGLFAGFLLAGFSTNLPMFVLALMIQGTFGGAMAASNAYLSTQFKDGDLSRALNWTQYSARLAMISGPILLGLLTAQGLGLELYRYLAWLPLLAFVMILPLPADTPRQTMRAANAADSLSQLPTDLPRLLTVQFLFSFAMVVTFPYFVPYGEALGIGNDAVIGLLYSLPHLVYLFALPWVQRHTANLLLPGLGLLAVSNALQFWSTQPEPLFALRLLSGVGMLLSFVGLHRCLSLRSRHGSAGRMFGWFDASGKWAGTAAGGTAGLVSQTCGIESPFLVACLAAVAAMAVARPLLMTSREMPA